MNSTLSTHGQNFQDSEVWSESVVLLALKMSSLRHWRALMCCTWWTVDESLQKFNRRLRNKSKNVIALWEWYRCSVFQTVIFTAIDIAQSVGANHVLQSARDSAVEITNIHAGSFCSVQASGSGLEPDSIRISGAGSGFPACRSISSSLSSLWWSNNKNIMFLLEKSDNFKY